MKTRGILFAAFAAAGLTFGITSCDKALITVNVPMEFTEISFDVPVTPASGSYVDSATVTPNLDSILNANSVKKENIKSIKLESISLTCEGDSANNFRLLQSVTGAIAKDGGAYTTVGEVTNNPDVAAFSLGVPVSSPTTDYKPYLDGATFSFKVSGTTRRAVTAPIHIKAKIKFVLEGGV